LNHEKGTLWQLFTFPRSLLSLLMEKTLIWAGFAFLYAGTTLGVLAYFSRHLHYSALTDGFIALYGVILYAFIAAGIGVLATNVLEDSPRARMRADMVYLYLLLIGMYAYPIYAPSFWAKLGQLVLSTLLGFALWQKVKDRLPYLLDPQASPPPNISLADGLIAALAFFVLQGVSYLGLLQAHSMPESMRITLAYSVAGICVASLTLYSLWHRKIDGLWNYLGFISLRYASRAQGTTNAIVYGLVGGGVAACGAALYLHVLTLVPSWETWKETSVVPSLLLGETNHLWLYGLFVISAPLCEEFIFRGLIYRGLRRTLHPAVAIVASAALFALVHPAISVVPVFGLGLATAFCFERTGLLLAPIIVHMTYNTCVIFLNR
jgi:ABC-2 type transport system permease protein